MIGFNVLDIEIAAESADQYVILTYAAMHPNDEMLAYSRADLLKKFHVEVIPTGFWPTFFTFKYERVYSNFKSLRHFNFINPEMLRKQVSTEIRRDYIRLVSLVSMDQRWRYKIWREPITVPKIIVQDIHRIPNDWYQEEENTIRLIKEEDYYGKKLGRY